MNGRAQSGTIGAAGRPPRIALLAVTSARGERGGAERLYDGLHAALVARGVAAARIDMPSDERNFDSVLRTYLRFYDADLSGYDGVISTKAPSYVVRHRNQVCYLPHTMRVFYDMFESTFPAPSPALCAQRDIIREIDTAALTRSSVRGVFVVGDEVRDRLRTFNGIDGEVLHHPSTFVPLPPAGAGYILIPGRLHKWKRVDLAIDAVRAMRNAVDLVICGAGDEEGALRARAGGDARIRFAGHVEDDALARLYAGALAVIYCPQREDYGLVPVEAFMAGKPVVTCLDSGEPTRLVTEGVSGFVCAPEPGALAVALDRLADDRPRAAAMGLRGRDSVAQIAWDTVVARLLGALGLPRPAG